MGYRHSLISKSFHLAWPEWYSAKYSFLFYVTDNIVATKIELKFYNNDFFEDTQKALVEIGWFNGRISPFVFVAISDDGVVNKVQIIRERITYMVLHDGYELDGLDYYSG